MNKIKYKTQTFPQYRIFDNKKERNLANILNRELSQGWKMINIFMMDGECNILYEKIKTARKKPAKKK